jgi:hydroxymethylbilane synthase
LNQSIEVYILLSTIYPYPSQRSEMQEQRAAEADADAEPNGQKHLLNVVAETELQCPVAHAPSQPLPPGHPPTRFASASTLKPPTDPKCVFFRTTEDMAMTPPLSRQASVQLEQIKLAANINPLQQKDAPTLNPDTSLVLSSRNSRLALVQASSVSAMLASHYGNSSPAFSSSTTRNGSSSAESTPPPSPPSAFSPDVVQDHQARLSKLGISNPMSFPITSMSTAGDKNLKSPLYVIGGEGKAIWTKELEVALAQGAVDAIVHCLKDIPTTLPDGLMLGAILQREDPRDALVVKKGLPYTTCRRDLSLAPLQYVEWRK